MSEPTAELHAGFSDSGAKPKGWAEGRRRIDAAQVFWITTVRPDGRPHMTPLLAAWHDDAMYFCTGDTERKADNLRHNPSCILTAGASDLDGLDVVIEGQAAKVDDPAELRRVADAYEAKYGPHLEVPGGTWAGLGDTIRSGGVPTYRVTPEIAFGFARGAQFSQTRWRFDR